MDGVAATQVHVAVAQRAPGAAKYHGGYQECVIVEEDHRGRGKYEWVA